MPAQNLKPKTSTVAIVGTLLALCFLLGSLFAIETILAFSNPMTKSNRIASLREQGIHAVPAMTPQIILLRQRLQGLRSKGRELIPLGGLANVQTVYCREAGDLIQYQSDRFGFRNQDQLWDQQTQLIAIGDSYTQGSCVHDDEHMVGVLRRRYKNTLNLGSFGNGPLANLAVLTEYAITQKPEVILWFYVANDMSIDYSLESANPVLRQYMQPGFTQNLRQRQPAIDAALAPFLEKEWQRQIEEEKPLTFWRLTRTLSFLRQSTTAFLRPQAPDQPAEFDYDQQDHINYAQHAIIVATAAQRARENNSQFVFVIVPDARMFRTVDEQHYKPSRHVEKLVDSIQNMGVDVIDLYSFLESTDQPEQYYAALDGYYGHFSKEGYNLVGTEIKRQLDLLQQKQKMAKQP
jgi:lysophospholipase L1-like esterase